MNPEEVNKIYCQATRSIEEASADEAEFHLNMALLISALISVHARSVELQAGGEGVRRWFSVVSEILSKSLAEAYNPPSTLSVSIVVAEKMPKV